ncbi:MAG: hypothetical protein JSV51_04340 [Candidatus Bathyarchaeota archaeon]|nr:MAG: hypothetical protein JSV51_04340 [Candidatus Bathyarchaeota archaeon]
MRDPFERGKAWFLYSKLEDDFIRTTPYVALESVHSNVWSERFGELLARTGDLVDSFFRLMVNSKSLDNEIPIKNLRVKIIKEQETNPNWFPKINDFRATFNPIFQLSSVEVEADYGLTYYGRLQPFKGFDKQGPSWWNPYNKVRHEIFEQIEKKATLENAINALASLFALNILHKESQGYLIKYQNVIVCDYMKSMPKEQILQSFKASKIGIPKTVGSYNFRAATRLFTHTFRIDKQADAV